MIWCFIKNVSSIFQRCRRASLIKEDETTVTRTGNMRRTRGTEIGHQLNYMEIKIDLRERSDGSEKGPRGVVPARASDVRPADTVFSL